MSDSATLLIVEDDPYIRTFLADNLTADQYEVLVAPTLDDAWRELYYKQPDLAIVDLNLPDGTGLELVRRVRAADGGGRLDPAMPLIMLSGSGTELDIVRGFERGLDDYITKPFAYSVLRHRIGAVLRRARGRVHRGLLRVGELEIDPASRSTTLHGQRVPLAAKEFALLRTLASSPTRVFTKEELLKDVWGFQANGSTRTLDSHACRLRSKLQTHGDRFIVNVWGVGYRLIDGPVGEEAMAA